ncbi:MAG: hypothetical protein WC070_03945 [Candidatus Magasanikbacteria bacterium]
MADDNLARPILGENETYEKVSEALNGPLLEVLPQNLTPESLAKVKAAIAKKLSEAVQGELNKQILDNLINTPANDNDIEQNIDNIGNDPVDTMPPANDNQLSSRPTRQNKTTQSPNQATEQNQEHLSQMPQEKEAIAKGEDTNPQNNLSKETTEQNQDTPEQDITEPEEENTEEKNEQTDEDKQNNEEAKDQTTPDNADMQSKQDEEKNDLEKTNQNEQEQKNRQNLQNQQQQEQQSLNDEQNQVQQIKNRQAASNQLSREIQKLSREKSSKENEKKLLQALKFTLDSAHKIFSVIIKVIESIIEFFASTCFLLILFFPLVLALGIVWAFLFVIKISLSITIKLLKNKIETLEKDIKDLEKNIQKKKIELKKISTKK